LNPALHPKQILLLRARSIPFFNVFEPTCSLEPGAHKQYGIRLLSSGSMSLVFQGLIQKTFQRIAHAVQKKHEPGMISQGIGP
jgi:hypothetical protein